jgi:glucose/arabinose dehydrogenase
MKRRIIVGTIGLVLLIGGVIFVFREKIETLIFKPTKSSIELGLSGKPESGVQVVATDLYVPWEIIFLPNGDMLVSERSGKLKRIGANSKTYTIIGVTEVGEGGLLGMALHPKFNENGWLYLYFTTTVDGMATNKIERYHLNDDRLSDRTTIITGIPAAPNHDGGRIAFGPDKHLYVAAGDAGTPENAQNKASLAGKILRITDEGKPVIDNPFSNEVYSYGHRNPQGLAWEDKGQLWATEHGPAGLDELNLIKKGANYGWPSITGDQQKEGMETPIANSGSEETWAPSGLVYSNGSLFFAGLRGQTLYQAKIDQNKTVTLKAHFREEYGRLRAISVHDRFIYFTTSNHDGRNIPGQGDDKILRIKASDLENLE